MTIIIEGLDGSGKTTYAKKYKRLKYIGFPNNPGVRQELFAQQHCFRNLVGILVKDMLEKDLYGYVIDRWIYSTIVYQSEDFKMSLSETIVKIQAIIGLELFDQMFYGVEEIHFLDTPFEMCKQRIQKRKDINKYDKIDKKTFNSRRDKYYQLFDRLITNSETEIRIIEPITLSLV